MKWISISNYVSCRFNTVTVVNIDDIDGKRVDTKVKWIMLLILMANLMILDFKRLILMMENFVFTNLNLCERTLHNPSM